MGEWDFLFTPLDLRYMAKYYLDDHRIEQPQLVDNLPGKYWGMKFMERHKEKLSFRIASNISRQRAAVTKSKLDEFFQNAEEVLRNVAPENLINYDETNLTDDPAAEKFIFKCEYKYPKRVLNSQPQSTISLMYSGTASGYMFPAYVVYKALEMWSTWNEKGPPGTRLV